MRVLLVCMALLMIGCGESTGFLGEGDSSSESVVTETVPIFDDKAGCQALETEGLNAFLMFGAGQFIVDGIVYDIFAEVVSGEAINMKFCELITDETGSYTLRQKECVRSGWIGCEYQ